MNYILIHGLGQDISSWEKTIACLEDDFHVFCPDLFHLLSDREPVYNNLYRAFTEYCQKLNGPVNLCGLSLGAVLALNYALDCPEKVNSLILIGAQYKMPKFLLKVQSAIFRFMPNLFFDNLGINKNSFIQLSKSMMALDFSNRLTGIRCAALILCGEKDTTNKKAAQELADNIPKAELQMITKAGHEVNLEAPEKLADIITAFWNRNIK